MKSVLGDLRVTLYDIFGYLVPGLVALAGIGIFLWACFEADAKPDADVKGVVWTALLLIAYLVGHLIQAVANKVPRFALHLEREWHKDVVSGRFRKAIEKGLDDKGLLPVRPSPEKPVTPEEEEEAQIEAVFRMCDEVVVQKGDTSERELYTYREGFYRGMAVALVFLAIGLAFRLLRGPASIVIDKEHEATRAMLGFFLLLVLGGALASKVRYKRFAEYRVRTVLLGAPLLLMEPTKKKSDPDNGD